jgi:L-ribulose-5-phosphate 3-epimerase UlaE
MELGVYSGCVVGDILRDKFLALRDIGYDFLELALGRDDLPAVREGWEEELRELAQETGVPVKSLVWGGFPEFGRGRKDPDRREQVVEDVVEMVRFAHRVGADVILLPVWEGEGLNYEEGLELYREGLRPCVEVAEAEGVTLALEHIPASKFANTGLAIGEVARSMGSDMMRVYYDIGNDAHIGQDPVKALSRLGPLVAQVHLKGTREKTLAAMPLADIRQVFSTLGFAGRGAVEISGKVNNDHLVEALRVLRTFGF